MKIKFIRNLVAAGALTAVVPVSAQGGLVLEEVVVTAQKRAESLQDVAGSISALDSRQLELRGVQNTEDLFQAIPGLNFSTEAGSNLITIRGIGLQVDSGAAEPGVATHVDGVYQARATMSGVASVDLERIEVLRGPQGTLYGRNATGGVVNFITKKPTEEFEGAVTVGIGSWDKVKASAYVSGPLVEEKVLGRLSVNYSDHDGYVRNFSNVGDDRLRDEEVKGVRGALSILASDSTTIDLSFNSEEIEFQPFQERLDNTQLTIPQLTPAAFGGVPVGAFTPDGAHNIAVAFTPFSEKETDSASATITWDVNDNITFKSITGYTDHSTGPSAYDADTYIFPDGTVALQTASVGGIGFPSFTESESFSQEFNLVGSSFDDKLQWTLGLYYFDEEYVNQLSPQFNDLAPLLNFTQSFEFLTEEDITSVGAFADLTYSFSDTFRLNLGLRRSEDEKDVQQTITGFFGPTRTMSLPVVLCGVNTPLNGTNEFDWDSTSPKIRFEWDATDNLLLYAQWQEGFKTGGVNSGQCFDTFDPEEIISYETGFKSTLLDGSMTLNGSAYFYDYENLQVFGLDQSGLATQVDNIPEAEVYGAEVELVWNMTDIVSTDFSIAVADSEITKGAVLFDTVAAINGANPLINIEGNSVPRNPDLTVSLGVNLDLDTDNGSFGVRGEVYYSDETQFGLFGNDEQLADSYTVANLYTTFTNVEGNITVRAFAKNITDEEYLYNILHSITTASGGSYAPPRHYGLEATYRF